MSEYKGISSKEAEKLLARDGYNQLEQKKKRNPIRIFANQFRDIMVMILLVATVVSIFLNEFYDAITIILIVLVNAILGFIQEYRTEKTLDALKNMTAPTAKVYRDGKLMTLNAKEIVVGDTLDVEAGDRVPADCAVISARGLFANESILTGESVAVGKIAGNADDTNNSLNKDNIVYSGTNITKGHATVKVIATGKSTQMGNISTMLCEIEQPLTPLQKRLAELGKVLALVCVGVCVIVFLAGIFRGEPIFDMLLTGITIAIAAIPEGLPATVTIALALAVSRMLKQKALVNKLHSVETLGCTSVICSDKTGTITENKMTVCKILAGGEEYDVSGIGYKLEGRVSKDGVPINPISSPALIEAMNCCTICNNAEINTKSSGFSRDRGSITGSGSWEVVGDPTEIALLVASAKCGITNDSLKNKYYKLDEIPFDSQTKCMTVFCSSNTGLRTGFCKGASDVILERCSFIQIGKDIHPLTHSVKKNIEQYVNKFSDGALRVLALAKKDSVAIGSEIKSGMVFLGLVGMMDPPRAEAKRAIKLCASAGIKTVMITGDHKNTAVAIARQAGLLRGGEAITGKELDKMSDEELDRKLEKISVYARVKPSHKLRLVKAYKRKGHIVTMTGDGVNDAPAIKEADVGVSMGITGTDVTKEAADVILLDDNFATLVNAVEQGRGIYSNIRKFVRYLLSCNIGEVITMFVGILMGFPVVLLPTQILLVNLVTDGLPAIALGLEPTEDGVMKKSPRKPKESFFSGGLMGKIVFRGIMIGLCTLGCFAVVTQMGGSLLAARTCALLTLVLSQLIHVFECKSEVKNIFTVKYFNNPKLILAVILSFAVIVACLYLPPLQAIFSTVAPTSSQLLTATLFSLAVPVASSIFSLGKKKERN